MIQRVKIKKHEQLITCFAFVNSLLKISGIAKKKMARGATCATTTTTTTSMTVQVSDLFNYMCDRIIGTFGYFSEVL